MSKKENIQTSHIISYGSINDAGDPWIDVEDKKPFEFKTFLKSYASSYIPSIVSWKSFILGDFFAGFTVGVMVIPQALSNAVIAGVDPIYGLYTAFLPCIVYALLGSSKHLVIGPTTIISLMVASWLKSPMSDGQHDAMALAFLVGIFKIIFSLLQAGFLTNVISFPISIGFTAGAGVLITFSQIRHLFGMKGFGSANTLFELISIASKYKGGMNGYTILFSSVSFVLVFGLKKFKYTRMIPGALLAVIIGTLLAYAYKLNHTVGLEIVKDIPKGLPIPIFPIKKAYDIVRLSPYALLIAIISIVESVSIAKRGQRISGNQELMALGMANWIGSFFQAFPATASFTRTAVNIGVGGKTPIAAFLASILVMCALLFLTPLLYYVPYAVLSAIIMTGVVSLFEFDSMYYIFKAQKRDFTIMVVTCLLTILLGIEWGIILSVLVHIVLLIISAFKLNIKTFQRDPIQCQSNIYLIEINIPLVYINSDSFSDMIKRVVKRMGAIEEPQYILLDFYKSNTIDSSAVKKLIEIYKELQSLNVNMVLVSPNEYVEKCMEKAGLLNLVKLENIFETKEQALEVIKSCRI